jgi:hypothetical protein
VPRRHRLLQRAQLVLHCGQVGRAAEDVLAQRPVAGRGRPLVVQRNPCALLQGQFAAVEGDLSSQHPE